MIIREVERPKIRDLIGWPRPPLGQKKGVSQREVLDKVQIVGSGKGAIALVLGYLSQKKIISNKLDEVMVADWIGYWVYNQIQAFAFSSKRFSERTKAILVYHQYGFPQDMDKILEFANDKKVIVIEDCAHALNSYYKGKPVGSFGDFAIYSFSKWFFCFALGGVKSKFEDFYTYAQDTISNIPFGLTLLKDLSKFLFEQSTFSNSRLFRKYANLFLNMSYSLYGEALRPSRLACRLLSCKIEQEIILRQKRYRYFLARTRHLGICNHLEVEGITPYAIPIYCSDTKNKALVRALRDKNITTGLYHFDINRNLLSPKFVQCVCIPCHRGISDRTFAAITDLVVKKLT